MRSRPLALAAVVGTLLIVGCGDDNGSSPSTAGGEAVVTQTGTQATLPSTAGSSAEDEIRTATVPSTSVTATTVTTSKGEASGASGGTKPPKAATVSEPPRYYGDTPSITTSGKTAKATAVDEGQAQVWCESAREGAYPKLKGVETWLITVKGSDDVNRCPLPQ